MLNRKGFIIRVLFLICLVFSIVATYYKTIVLSDYEVLTNESGVPDLEISYD